MSINVNTINNVKHKYYVFYMNVIPYSLYKLPNVYDVNMIDYSV